MARASAPFINASAAPARRLGFWLVAASSAVAAIGLASAQSAAASIDCTAVNEGALNVELAAADSATRTVALRSGETLNFTFRAKPGQFGTLTLLEGIGASRVLLMGATGTRVSFAGGGGAFRFRFAKEGEAAASFTASCVPTASASAGVGSPAPIQRRVEVPIRDGSVAAEALTDPAIAAALGAPKPLGDGEAAPVAAPKQLGGPEMKLQWRNERYMGIGPEGLLIDGNASGVEIGVNYKLQSTLMIGALAQFNPAAEMLFGGQRSLSDLGWMAGPVATVQIAPGLMLDARAAWGLGDTDPNDLTGTAAGAQRRLLSAKLTTVQAYGAWRLTPTINFSHLWEMLPTHGLAAAEISMPNAAGAGRVDIGPELSYRMELARSAFIEPKAVLGGFWGFDSLTKLTPGPGGHLDLRLKAEAGVTIGIVDGPKLQALGGVEEGSGAADAWTGRVQLNVPLK